MFWTQFVSLCGRDGKSPSTVASELKIASGSITAWSRGAQPRNATVRKIADYFGVTTQYLLRGESEQKKDPAVPGEVNALAAILDGLSDEQIEQVRQYAAFLRSRGE